MPVVTLTAGSHICNVEIPNAEYAILKAIIEHKKEITVRDIREWLAIHDNKEVSYASIYSLAKRLEKRKVITIEKVQLEFMGITYPRIVIKPNFETVALIPSSKSAS